MDETELRLQLEAANAGLYARQSELEEVQRQLRAAEDRLERWKDIARASLTDRTAIPGDPYGGWRWKWRAPKREVSDVGARISHLTDNLSGFIPTDALNSPQERTAALRTSHHWERALRAALTGGECF